MYNDEEEDENDESDYDEGEDELGDEPSADMPEESPVVIKSVRPARLRVFGRDFKQKDILKASEEVQSGRQAAQGFGLNAVLGSVVGVDDAGVGNDEVEQSWPPAGHLLTGSADGAERMSDKKPSSNDNSFASLSTEEVVDQQWPPVGTIFSGDSSASVSRDVSSEIGSSDRGDFSDPASVRLSLLSVQLLEKT